MSDSSIDLLRQFYGLDKEVESDPSDIDGKNFQAEPYFQNLIMKTSIPNLNQQCNKIEDEIKKLDGQLQNIINDNYTKFLLASETVKSMKDGLSSLSAQMKVLNFALAML